MKGLDLPLTDRLVGCIVLAAGFGLLIGDINGVALRGLAVGLIIGTLSGLMLRVSPLAFAVLAAVVLVGAILVAVAVVPGASPVVGLLALAALVVIVMAAVKEARRRRADRVKQYAASKEPR
ncbi:hypothetical protein WKY82_08990 [Gordonia malaquae]|uniref:hypothetical protein n=1 Tax=Gordonia malaquae TaxID=410332 RepID=UPI0030C787E1